MDFRHDECWSAESASDIHDCLKSKENAATQPRGDSPILYLRRYLVDWMALTCQKFRLNANAQHLAVALYDRFTEVHSVKIDDLKVLVVCCLLVSSKFEEREEKIPKFKVLMEHLQWDLKASDYLQMELKLLSVFNWNIGFSTASHFKDFYMQFALSDHDIHCGRPLSNREEALVYMEKNINYFLEVSLQDPTFLNFKPSLVSAACFACARVCLHISPTWTTELVKQTRFSWSELLPCIEALMRLYDEDRKATIEAQRASVFSAPQQRMVLDSTGNTPITSPSPSSTAEDSSHAQHFGSMPVLGNYRIPSGTTLTSNNGFSDGRT